MRDHIDSFPQINRGYDSTFQAGRLSLGLVVPITAYPDSPVPDMTGHLARVQRAEALDFRAVWLRDVPFDVSSFGAVFAELEGRRQGGLCPGARAAHHALRLVQIAKNFQRHRRGLVCEDARHALQRAPASGGMVVHRRIMILPGRRMCAGGALRRMIGHDRGFR
ncbi:hypothetical protein [Salipiger bermudensis]|uniref:hypothetical protein n=1 Tax=Salipiger bermudensis TaxID=344736 RepID=UPI001CD77E9F|nr:hypothetical protein [Salipiger bermudensis]MCA1288454.1 hypothetical protein [Salipiger bermudensis]